MKRFDICRFALEPADGPLPYVLVLQSDSTDELNTVIVAPVSRRPRGVRTPNLELPIEIGGEKLTALVQEMAAVARRDVLEIIGSASHLEWEIGRALDRLSFGV